MSHLLIVCWFLDTSSFLLHNDQEWQDYFQDYLWNCGLKEDFSPLYLPPIDCALCFLLWLSCVTPYFCAHFNNISALLDLPDLPKWSLSCVHQVKASHN